LKAATEEADRVGAERVRLRSEAETLDGRLQVLRRQADAVEARGKDLAEAEARLVRVRTELVDAEGSLRRTTDEITRRTADRDRLATVLAEGEGRRASLETALAEVQARQAASEADRRRTAEALDALRAQLVQVQTEFGSHQERARAAQDEAARAIRERDRMLDEVENLRKLVSALTVRRDEVRLAVETLEDRMKQTADVPTDLPPQSGQR
jgi:chromosome segregation ATPase